MTNGDRHNYRNSDPVKHADAILIIRDPANPSKDVVVDFCYGSSEGGRLSEKLQCLWHEGPYDWWTDKRIRVNRLSATHDVQVLGQSLFSSFTLGDNHETHCRGRPYGGRYCVLDRLHTNCISFRLMRLLRSTTLARAEVLEFVFTLPHPS